MKNIITTKPLIILSILMCIFTVASAAVLTTDQPQIPNSKLTWTQAETATIEATGFGLPPEETKTAAQIKYLARRAAIVDAYRNLLELTQTIHVDSETTIQNIMIANDTVNTKVSGLIHGSKIIREQQNSDGSYQVTVSLNLYGDNSLASITLPQITPSVRTPFPAPNTDITPANLIKQNYDYTPTGLIIDARNLGLETTFSPVVYDTAGRAIYGAAFIDPDYAIKYGMVDYASNPELVEQAENGQSRAGNFPIIIKAVALKNNNYNVIISQSDAEKILAANQTTDFLNKYAVVFYK